MIFSVSLLTPSGTSGQDVFLRGIILSQIFCVRFLVCEICEISSFCKKLKNNKKLYNKADIISFSEFLSSFCLRRSIDGKQICHTINPIGSSRFFVNRYAAVKPLALSKPNSQSFLVLKQTEKEILTPHWGGWARRASRDGNILTMSRD